MGNTNTKEARDVASPRSPHDPRFPQQQDSVGQSSSSRHRSRTSRSDLGSLLGISQGSSSSAQPPYERRETKQEREARRLEKERQARLIERERSLKEEHVDGGYLVTLGTYVGPEDYSKPTVRQLQVRPASPRCPALPCPLYSTFACLLTDCLRRHCRLSGKWRPFGGA